MDIDSFEFRSSNYTIVVAIESGDICIKQENNTYNQITVDFAELDYIIDTAKKAYHKLESK